MAHVHASVVPIGRRVKLSEPDQRQLRVRQVDRAMRAVCDHLVTCADLLEPLQLDYGEEIPAHEELRLLALGIGQIRGALRTAVGID